MSLQINNAVGWVMVIITLAFVGCWVPHEEKVLGSSYLIFFSTSPLRSTA